MPYKHLFFDLDHTLWDFDPIAGRHCLIFIIHCPWQKPVCMISIFFINSTWAIMSVFGIDIGKGQMKVDELRWKRMAMTLLEFKNGDESLARKMGIEFLEILPTKKTFSRIQLNC